MLKTGVLEQTIHHFSDADDADLFSDRRTKRQKRGNKYVLLFFCLKNIAHFHSPETRTSLFSRECKLQKGIFGQFNTLKFIYLRLDPLHPDNQTIKSLSVPPDNSGTKNKPVQTNPQKENRIGNDPEL